MAQHLHPNGDSSDRNTALVGAGLQSFGGGNGGGLLQENNPNINSSGGGDYFNSDSFRATGTQDNLQQQQAAAVLDLQYHGQPFHGDDYEEEDKEESMGSSEQRESNHVLTDRTGGGNDEQLSPVNMAEF